MKDLIWRLLVVIAVMTVLTIGEMILDAHENAQNATEAQVIANPR